MLNLERNNYFSPWIFPKHQGLHLKCANKKRHWLSGLAWQHILPCSSCVLCAHHSTWRDRCKCGIWDPNENPYPLRRSKLTGNMVCLPWLPSMFQLLWLVLLLPVDLLMLLLNLLVQITSWSSHLLCAPPPSQGTKAISWLSQDFCVCGGPQAGQWQIKQISWPLVGRRERHYPVQLPGKATTGGMYFGSCDTCSNFVNGQFSIYFF